MLRQRLEREKQAIIILKINILVGYLWVADGFDNIYAQAMEKDHQEIVTKLERVEEGTISKMRDQHQNTVATMKNQHQDMVAKMKNQHQDMVAKMEHQHQDLVGKMAVKHQELVTRMEEENEESVATIRLLEERLANKVPLFLLFFGSFSLISQLEV